MGIIMKALVKKYNWIAASTLFIGLPILFWLLGDIPKRSVLKEIISILTILSFFMMVGQFFLARSNDKILKNHKMGKVIKIHKIIGYVFVSILLVHPFLIVVPRYFESGVSPVEAFITIITTFDSIGIILGMIAWCLMLIIGITSFFRYKLGLKNKTWKLLHGFLSILFVSLATWHAIDLGRHTDEVMSVLMIILAMWGIYLLLRSYLKPTTKKVVSSN